MGESSREHSPRDLLSRQCQLHRFPHALHGGRLRRGGLSLGFAGSPYMCASTAANRALGDSRWSGLMLLYPLAPQRALLPNPRPASSRAMSHHRAS